MKIQLICFICGIVIYAVVFTVFSILIAKSKKLLKPESSLRKTGAQYWGVFVSSVLLLFFPAAIHMELLPMISIEGCAVLGEFIVLRDRYQSMQKEIKGL